MSTVISGSGMVATTRVNTKAARRRLVVYSSFSDFAKDLDKVEAAHLNGTLRPLGNRQAGPIFGHLAVSMRDSMEENEALKGVAPLWLRLVGPIAKSRVLGRPFQPGVKLPSRAEIVLWNDSLSFESGLKELRSQIERISRPGNEPRQKHPIFGALSVQEWGTFHLRHAELHMSFLQP